MADLAVRIKTFFNKKGVDEARNSFNNIDSGLRSVIGAARSMGAAFAAKEVIEGVVRLSEIGSESLAVARTFENLSGGAAAARANLIAMTRATRGLVDVTTQQQIANQLLGMNIAQTDEELEQVVSVSRRLGKEFKGLGAREAAEEFAIMISNMSVARLDSFGLSSGNVRQRIDELMRTTEGMTREQAFFQATMEESEETLSRLGPELNTTSDEVQRLSGEWANFQSFLGETVESSGLVRNIFSELSKELVSLRRFLGDDTLETQISDVTTQLERQRFVLERKLEEKDSFFGFLIGEGQLERVRSNISGLETELSSLLAQQEGSAEQGRAEQERQQAAIRGEEIAAENAKKREESTKKLAEVQKQFSKDIISLQGQTEQELADSQDQFDRDRERSAEDHAKRIADIRRKFAKDEDRAAKRLQRDLLKVDKDLNKSLIKQQADENKRISKFQADAAKSERNDARRKQIDALADERLFQFELRNLAADGQGIAIKEALERREIEQQIASEKAEFEKGVERDKRQDTIATIRQEGQEARDQLQQQAADRKADLRARSEEEAAARAERIAEELAQEGVAFAEKKEQLQEALIEQDEAIRDGERKRIAEISKGLTETENLTNSQLDRMIALAGEFGPKFGETFAKGMTDAFSENLKIESAIEKSGVSLGAGVSGLPLARGGDNRPGGLTIFQQGGEVTRSGLAFVEQGEVVANPAQGQAVVIGGEQFAVREANRLAEAINTMRAKDMQELVDTVAAAL